MFGCLLADEGMSEMFTGRIDEIGHVVEVSDARVVVHAPKSAGTLLPGGSLAVAGVCLTAEDVGNGQITASLSRETRRRTTFDRHTGGELVNVETALAFGDPLDGHLVQVTWTWSARSPGVTPQGRACGSGSGRRTGSSALAPKGSIAVDGASLTVAEVLRDRFSVVLIPATLQQTTLNALLPGEYRVNLESDLVARLPSAGSPAAAAEIARAVGSLGWAGGFPGAEAPRRLSHRSRRAEAVPVWDPDREGEGDVIFAGATMSPEAFTFLLTRCCGHSTVPCAPEVLERLEIAPIPGEGDRHGTRPHIPVDLASGTGTGVSAVERAATVRRIADPDARPTDFLRPGHVFPLAARAGLLAERAGHTESTVALCTAAGLPPVGVCCEVMGPDGVMARG